MFKLRRLLLATLVAGATLIPTQSQAFFGWMMPWNWFGNGWGWNDYYYPYYGGGPWGYGGYPYYGGGPWGYGGYPYYGGGPWGYGGYPHYGGYYPYAYPYAVAPVAPKTETKADK